MADVTYNIDTLYRAAFPDLARKVLGRLDGVRDLALEKVDKAIGNGFTVPVAGKDKDVVLDFTGIPGKAVVQGDELSYLGTPIFQPITFLGGTYQQLGTGDKAGQVIEVPYAGWQLPATATAEFRRGKQIEKSAPNGAYGTTKELWAFADWEVTIRGLLLDGEPGIFPSSLVRELVSWDKIVDAIDVTGEMFRLIGVKRLVIDNLNIGKVAGMPNVVPFQLECSSDEPLEIAIQENQLPESPMATVLPQLPTTS